MTNNCIGEIELIKNRIVGLGKSEVDEQETRHLLNYLIDNVKKSCEKPKKTYGNPAVVGLAGFGITTLLFQCYNFGLMKPGPVLWLGLVYGGLSQFIAGLLEFASANNFGFSAFTTYGAFWIALVAMLIANDYTKYEARDPELALFLAAFAIYTFIMFIASTKHNVAIALVFLLLFAGLVLLSAFHFYPHIKALKMAGAGTLVVCAVGALYNLAHLIFLESFKTDILPVGPPIGSKPKVTTTSVGNNNSCGSCYEEKPHEGITLIHLQSKSH